MKYQKILENIEQEVSALKGTGKVASYIPELAKVPADHFGMALLTLDGQVFQTGDADTRFSIQSISKTFSLIMAIRAIGESLFERVGREPSGNPFNSLMQLEYEKGIPRNPFINAGALVVTDVLLDILKDPKQEILDFVRKISGNPAINYDLDVVVSEKETGFTNAALANYLKSHGNLKYPVETVLDVYFHQCSLSLSCIDLARAFLLLANHGVIPSSGERVLSKSQSKRLSALMLTCGFYDEAGEFAFRVGLPGKSGVGGGIVAILPENWCVAVWSPEINRYGNSVRGMKALELLTTLTGESIF